MSTFDYTGSKEMALRLVEKFGTVCKVVTPTKTKTARIVFMKNNKGELAATQSQSKQVYITGIDVKVSATDKLQYKQDVYLITDVEEYNFDGTNRILYVLTIAK